MNEAGEKELWRLAKKFNVEPEPPGSYNVTVTLARGFLDLLDERKAHKCPEPIETLMEKETVYECPDHGPFFAFDCEPMCPWCELKEHKCPPCDHPQSEDLKAALLNETLSSWDAKCEMMRAAIEAHRCPSPASARLYTAVDEWSDAFLAMMPPFVLDGLSPQERAALDRIHEALEANAADYAREQKVKARSVNKGDGGDGP